jgi:S-DNA-T family DNA segregation ATPase FtsK/SpoIIIE
VIDYRRAMLGEVEGEHLIGYATTAAQAQTLLSSVAEYMHARLPGPDVTPKELRERSWYSGPECFVLIDDYDLVAAGSNPVSPLLEFLAQARDVGLHVIIARRSGGAGRALYEPIMARLRELATPGLILSGDGDEGSLIGVRPQNLPPGRATYVTRRDGARMVQLAYLPPTETAVETPSDPADLPADETDG